jgi:hypothetical protein
MSDWEGNNIKVDEVHGSIPEAVEQQRPKGWPIRKRGREHFHLQPPPPTLY